MTLSPGLRGCSRLQPAVECYRPDRRRRQTPATVTSLLLYTMCRRASNNKRHLYSAVGSEDAVSFRFCFDVVNMFTRHVHVYTRVRPIDRTNVYRKQ